MNILSILSTLNYTSMKNISKLVHYFTPNTLENNSFLLRKVKVIIFVILFLIAISMTLLILDIMMKGNNLVLIWPGIILAIVSLFILKFTANLHLVGNLMSFFWVLSIIFYIPQTGGLHSDNLLWLIIAPLISLLFSNKKWGLLWLFALIVFTVGLYFQKESELGFIKLDKSYYLISFIFLFVTIFCTVLIFEHGQILIIKMLQEQKQVLEEQKKILEFQKLELELQKQEILKKNIELEALRDSLSSKNFELEHFASNASHDLKEPLRMISMYMGLVKRRLPDVDPKREKYIFYITDGVARMEKLMTDLLNFSRLGKNIEDTKEVDLNTILYEVILNLTVTIKETGTTITTGHLPTIMASNTEMRQLFQNLIANAIKFRKDTVLSEIQIKYKACKEVHLITVKDNGIGIKKEYQSKVFGMFERLNDREKYEGSGIGLSTCEKIMTQLKGKIWLRSEEGIGTTFYIAIPKVQNDIFINDKELSMAL
jgi:signal transduction histidine kinase